MGYGPYSYRGGLYQENHLIFIHHHLVHCLVLVWRDFLFRSFIRFQGPSCQRTQVVKELKRIKIRDLSSYFYLVLCIGTMQYTTNYVFDHMEVGYALALFQLSTIVSIFLGYRIFKEENITKKLIGSVIMVAGSVMIILLK